MVPFLFYNTNYNKYIFMSKFAPLHIISGYSFLKSGLTTKRIIKSVTKQKYFGAGISDINVMFGIPEFTEAMKEANLPYIIGMTIAIDNNELTLYALNEIGYHQLINISTAIQKEELNFDVLKENAIGLLCVIETNHGKFKEMFDNFSENQTAFTKYLYDVAKPFGDNFYLGIEVTSKEEVSYANKIRYFANEYTYQCVAFPRIKYQEKDDAIVLKIVQAIENNEKIEDKKAQGQEYFMSETDYEKIYTTKEIENTVNIIKKSTFDLNQKRGELLHYTLNDSEKMLKDKCYEALANYGKDGDQNYIERLAYELSVIVSMGYIDYFLLVQDYVNWSKNNGILVGPGRGSAAGSLVSFLLKITEIDPLKYDLQFERFLNPNRKTMPDIDIDFMDTRRDEVVEYMRNKYGKDRVSTIIAYQTIQAKQALRDIGRIYNYPERHTVLISKALTNKEYGLVQSYYLLPEFKKLIDSDTYFQEYISLASKIEGLPRQDGQHAAGIIVNNKPIEKDTPILIDLDDNYKSQYEAKYLEEQGFLKMDFLGLTNLTTIDVCLKLIKKYKGIDLKFEDIPYDDPTIFDLIKTGKTIGLFQIETAAMKRGIKVVKPSTFDDVVALIALNRPGPMQFIKNYADRRDGLEKITYLSPVLESILAPTYGIIVYQEQINRIATTMAGFTPGEADMFRRAISKKDKDKIASLKEQFISGSIKLGHTPKVSNDVFNLIGKFANYGFNKSHSVVYAVIACRMAYLKANYPLEFYTAIFETSSSANDTKFNEYINELKSRGMKIELPSINESTNHFVIKNSSLVFPLTAISGINDTLVRSIMEARNDKPFNDFFDFVTRMFAYKISETQINKLIDAGAFDEFSPSRESLRLSVLAALKYAETFSNEEGQIILDLPHFAAPMLMQGYDDPLENLQKEYEVLHVMLSGHPLEYKTDLLRTNNVVPITELSDNEEANIAGIVMMKKIIKTKKGTQMAYIKILDQTGDIEVTVFPKTFDESYSLLDKNKIIVINGKKEGDEESGFIANKISKLED